jgi:glutamine synthetase
MKEILGDHIHSFFVANKKAEWSEYVAYVTPWETDKYLSIL